MRGLYHALNGEISYSVSNTLDVCALLDVQSQSTTMKRSYSQRLLSTVSEHRWFVALLVLFVATATWYNVATPIGESDNELSHFRYIQYIQAKRALPPISYEWPEPETQDQCLDQSQSLAPSGERQFRQPPLYYLLSAATFFWLDTSENWWPPENKFGLNHGHLDGGQNAYVHELGELQSPHKTVVAVHLIRTLSLVLGALGLVAVYGIGRLLFPGKSKSAAILMVSLTVFVPTYLFSSAVINNDILVGVLGLWCIYFCLLSALHRIRFIPLAVAAGLMVLALLTKYTGAFLLPVFTLTIVVVLIKSARTGAHSLIKTVLFLVGILALPLIVGIGWLVRNQRLYGSFIAGYPGLDLSPSSTITDLIARPYSELVHTVADTGRFTFDTYWGLLGADSVIMPGLFLTIAAVFAIPIVIGVLWYLVRSPRSDENKGLVLLGLLVLVINLLFYYSVVDYGPRGRYYLALYPIIAFITVWGTRFVSSRKYQWLVPSILSIFVIVSSILVPVFVLKPIYAQPSMSPDASLLSSETPVHALYGDFAELVGISIEPRDAIPYEPVDVTLVWRVLKPTPNNYVVGVHLAANDQTYMGGTSHFPDNGNYATSLWQPGDIFRDHYRLYVESNSAVELPTGSKIKVSMFCRTNDGDLHLSVSTLEGESFGNAVYSDLLRLGLPLNPDESVPDDPMARFGDEIALNQIGGIPQTLYEEEELLVEFELQALKRPNSNYSIYLQLLNEENRVVVGADYPLTQDYYPSSLWLAGEQIEHQHPFDLGVVRLLPGGEYRLITGLYDVESGLRPPFSSDSPLATEHGLLLGTWQLDHHLLYTPLILGQPEQ